MNTPGESAVLQAAPYLSDFPLGLSIPMLTEDSKPVEYAEALGEAYLSFSKHNHRKNGGHYLTPAAIARFMAEQLLLLGAAHARPRPW